MSERNSNLTGGRFLARNVVWNLIGTIAPLVVGVFAIPVLIAGLGIERFGVLTLAWMVVGYLSLFDFGLGRALTKLVAEKLGDKLVEDIPSLIWTGVSLMAFLGLLGAIVAASLSPWLVGNLLEIPAALQAETLAAFFLLAACVPVVIGTTGFRGVLEAHQRFGLVNAVRMPLGLVTFIGPVAVLPFSNSLVPVVAVLVIARLASLVAYCVLCLRVEPGIRSSKRFELVMVRPLVTFGGWMTVSNVVGPMMVYLDRFLIAGVLSISAVAYYATPYEVITKLWIIPAALIGVIFPAFSSAYAGNRDRAVLLFDRSVHYCILAMFPLTIVVVTLAQELMSLWLGSDFAANSTTVLQLLSIGVFINSIARVPFALVQGGGRPDLIAKVHIVELPFYLLVLWLVLPVYGINGVALVWLLRVTIDAIIFFLLSRFMLPKVDKSIKKTMWVMLASCSILAASLMLTNLQAKIVLLSVVLPIFAVLSWTKMLSSEERSVLVELGYRLSPIRSGSNRGK